jgi:hypothetical protein
MQTTFGLSSVQFKALGFPQVTQMIGARQELSLDQNLGSIGTSDGRDLKKIEGNELTGFGLDSVTFKPWALQKWYSQSGLSNLNVVV